MQPISQTYWRFSVLFVLSSLFSFSLIAQNWSSPTSWPNGVVPRAGDAVTIPANQRIILDISPPPLAGLTINGTINSQAIVARCPIRTSMLTYTKHHPAQPSRSYRPVMKPSRLLARPTVAGSPVRNNNWEN